MAWEWIQKTYENIGFISYLQELLITMDKIDGPRLLSNVYKFKWN